jgi:putative pyruvate formate lyase activating enzyme
MMCSEQLKLYLNTAVFSKRTRISRDLPPAFKSVLITGMKALQPGYIALYKSGQLEQRARNLEARLARCDICPRKCLVNRLQGEVSFCHSGKLPIISSVCAHHGEEPAISGSRGSGAIFLGNCNLRCVYCQNYQISQNWQMQKSFETDCHTLARKMLYLQDELNCHNINFVSPSHFVPQLVRAVFEAVPLGLHIPLVYNTNSYDSVDTLQELEGIIGIYLPDIKYSSDDCAVKYSQAKGYVAISRSVIKEMHRQVGDLIADEDGIAQRGVLVRHLVLPNGIAGSEESLKWLSSELSNSVTVSVMSQYLPAHRAPRVPLLSRKVSIREYDRVRDLVSDLGLENGWLQEMSSPESYLPDFDRKGHPFSG